MDRRRFIQLLGAGAAVPVLTACTGLDARDDNRVEVSISDISRFTPSGITVKVGDTVAWRNHDTRSHSVSTDANKIEQGRVFVPYGADAFESGELLPGGRYSYTFTVAGNYLYGCSLHPDEQLTGTITVEPKDD